jgi:hypothetical protein
VSDHLSNRLPIREPQEKSHPQSELSLIGILTAVNVGLQTIASALGNLAKIDASLGLVLTAIVVTATSSVVLWRRRSLSTTSAILLSYASLVTWLLIIILVNFVNRYPIGVRGKVVYPSNELLVTACVEIRNRNDHSLVASLPTEADGTFRFAYIEPGVYTLYITGISRSHFKNTC